MPPSSSLGSIAAAPWVRTTTQRRHKPPNPQVSSAPPLLLATCTGGLQGGGTPAGDEDGWEGIGDERRGGYRGGQEDGSAEWGGQHDHEVYDGNGRAVSMEFVFLVVGAIRQGGRNASSGSATASSPYCVLLLLFRLLAAGLLVLFALLHCACKAGYVSIQWSVRLLIFHLCLFFLL